MAASARVLTLLCADYTFDDLSSQLFANDCDETMDEVNVDDEITLDVDQVHRDQKKGANHIEQEERADFQPSASTFIFVQVQARADQNGLSTAH